MLTPDQIATIADELAEADRAHAVIPRITARYPEATVEDGGRVGVQEPAIVQKPGWQQRNTVCVDAAHRELGELFVRRVAGARDLRGASDHDERREQRCPYHATVMSLFR